MSPTPSLDPDSTPVSRLRRAPIHPGGVFVARFLGGGEFGKQIAAARRMKWTRNRMQDFVQGHRTITASAALDLETFTGVAAEYWLQLQSRVDLWKELQERRRRARVSP